MNVCEQFHIKVSFPAFCHWARLKIGPILVQLSGQKYRVIYCRQIPWCAARMCAVFLPFAPAQLKNDRPALSELIRGQCGIHTAGRMFRKVFLLFSGPWIASHWFVWMQRVAVHPFRHRADNTAPDGSLLWPVTQRSQGQSSVKRGQSLRTPYRVPLSSEGHVVC